jgi:hypothetical protein
MPALKSRLRAQQKNLRQLMLLLLLLLLLLLIHFWGILGTSL